LFQLSLGDLAGQGRSSLRRFAADFSSKNQALTRKIARPELPKGFGELEGAPKPVPSETSEQRRTYSIFCFCVDLNPSSYALRTNSVRKTSPRILSVRQSISSGSAVKRMPRMTVRS
jgi:hypothetical protein